MKNYLKTYLKIFNIRSSSAGFTLVELMIAMALTTIVVSAAGFGLVTLTDNNKKAEAKTQRRIELSRASDFIMNEIRMARRINTTTNTTTTASAAVTASNTATAFSPSLGSTGTIVLYLEIPITSTITGNCPAGTSRAGLAPATFDRVVYDIRSSTSTWLSPRTINRYGRIPANDGTIDPCSNPVASEALVDSILDTPNINPTCTSPAVLSGAEGFYACVNGRLVDLYLRSKVSSTENYDLSGKGFARVVP
jgi:prepilin-type N-terminal cleavage/methylation domain-containing protein